MAISVAYQYISKVFNGVMGVLHAFGHTVYKSCMCEIWKISYLSHSTKI